MASYRYDYFNEVKRRVAAEHEAAALKANIEFWVGFARTQDVQAFMDYAMRHHGVNLTNRKMILADIMEVHHD